jgi:hypothetical protein
MGWQLRMIRTAGQDLGVQLFKTALRLRSGQAAAGAAEGARDEESKARPEPKRTLLYLSAEVDSIHSKCVIVA